MESYAKAISLLTEIKQEQMPYKKESPFANFRDPKRTTKN